MKTVDDSGNGSVNRAGSRSMTGLVPRWGVVRDGIRAIGDATPGQYRQNPAAVAAPLTERFKWSG